MFSFENLINDKISDFNMLSEKKEQVAEIAKALSQPKIESLQADLRRKVEYVARDSLPPAIA